MRRYRIDFAALAAALALAWPPVTAVAADEPKAEPGKVEQAKEDIKSGARQAGREVKETAKEVGHEVKETAKEAGHAVKDAAKEAEPKAKSAWQGFKQGASDFGESVKTFFVSLFKR